MYISPCKTSDSLSIQEVSILFFNSIQFFILHGIRGRFFLMIDDGQQLLKLLLSVIDHQKEPSSPKINAVAKSGLSPVASRN
ncbi:hypothetical protein LguiB_021987 [Lonicera macranthoides]